MGFDPELLKQLIDTFKIELEEQLQVMTDGLLQLEKKSIDDVSKTKHIEIIFRAAHNIKGASQSLNIQDVAKIAHQVESIFSSIQKKMRALSPAMVDLCLEAVDKMRISMQFFLQEQPIPFNLADLLKRLETGTTGKKKAPKAPVVPTRIVAAKTITPIAHTAIEVKKKEPEKPVSEPPISLSEPKVHETIRVSIENLDRVAALMEEMQINKIAFDDQRDEVNQLAAIIKQLSQLCLQGQVAPKDLYSLETASNLQKIYSSSNDKLMELSNSIYKLNKNMRLRTNEFSSLSHSLQEEVRMLRLIPAANLLQSLPRAVRELSQEMNKKVELIIIGDDVKIDKMVLEGLKDPVIHLLRNAIDHGIEDSSHRLACGKSEMGHIWLEVVEEGNQILIRIKDDGAGINIEKISDVCIKKKLISSSELKKMNDVDILELIFLQGFSTREIITNVSGRGVGLSVVKENIANLKGNVTIATEANIGTTFDLRVPLTLTSERGLIVKSGGQLFVIPTASVEKVLSLQADAIIDVGATQAVLIDNHPVLLKTLAGILNLEKTESLLSEKMSLVVIRNGWHVIALLVETIVGEREIVVKPMQAPINKIKGLAGGTLSGSGQVMIVLNPADIITMTLQSVKMTRVVVQNDTSKTETPPHILVVDDSITTRTLEKSILEKQGFQVTIAVDGKEAWEHLQKEKFALLITDVMMPNVDGFTLTDRVKKTEKLQGMPVIIVTSLGSDAEKKRGIEVGADAYIVKNEFESGILLDIVKQLV